MALQLQLADVGFSRLSDETDKETFYLGPGKSVTTENRPRKKITDSARQPLLKSMNSDEGTVR